MDAQKSQRTSPPKRTAEGAKRPSKKRRPAVPAPSDKQQPAVEEEHIRALETAISESKKNYNNIVALFDIARSESGTPESRALATVALVRVFVRLLTTGNLVLRPNLSDKERTVVCWLRDWHAQLRKLLVGRISESNGAGGADDAAVVVTLAMRLLKAEQHLHDKAEYFFPRQFLADLLEAVLGSGDGVAMDTFVGDFVKKFVDVRFFAAKAMAGTLGGHDHLFDGAFALLSGLEPPPPLSSSSSSSAKREFFLPAPANKTHMLHSQLQHKKQVQDAWLAVMRLGMTAARRKQVLKIIATLIAPWFVQPELLADFLTDSYDAGGATSLLALSGVFYLVTERNLDYPSFYTKLYSLLDASLMHSRHRSRVFRLLDTCLGSSHLPAGLVASFIKRLARLALAAPPSAIVAVVPWLYNLLRKHPQTTFLMHRVTPMRDAAWCATCEADGFADPFDMAAADPMNTGALDSCIWEIVQLQSHYHPNVATIAKIVSEQFTKASYNVEDFLDHSYASVSLFHHISCWWLTTYY
jgi:U3 small nucleolar RNA-associated protein 19